MPIKEFQTRRVIKYQPLRFPKYVKDANDTTVYPAEVLKALVKELSKLYDNVVVLSPEYFVKKDNGGSLIDTYAFFDPDFTEEEFKTLMDNFLSQYDGHVTYKIKRFPKSARLQYGYVENFYKLSKDEERIGTATNLFRHKYKKEADLDSKKDQEELVKLFNKYIDENRKWLEAHFVLYFDSDKFAPNVDDNVISLTFFKDSKTKAEIIKQFKELGYNINRYKEDDAFVSLILDPSIIYSEDRDFVTGYILEQELKGITKEILDKMSDQELLELYKETLGEDLLDDDMDLNTIDVLETWLSYELQDDISEEELNKYMLGDRKKKVKDSDDKLNIEGLTISDDGEIDDKCYVYSINNDIIIPETDEAYSYTTHIEIYIDLADLDYDEDLDCEKCYDDFSNNSYMEYWINNYGEKKIKVSLIDEYDDDIEYTVEQAAKLLNITTTQLNNAINTCKNEVKERFIDDYYDKIIEHFVPDYDRYYEDSTRKIKKGDKKMKDRQLTFEEYIYEYYHLRPYEVNGLEKTELEEEYNRYIANCQLHEEELDIKDSKTVKDKPSDLTNIKVLKKEKYYDHDKGEEHILYLVEYIPQGRLDNGDNTKLYAVITDYNGEDVWTKGAIVGVNYDMSLEDFNDQLELRTMGKNAYLYGDSKTVKDNASMQDEISLNFAKRYTKK